MRAPKLHPHHVERLHRLRKRTLRSSTLLIALNTAILAVLAGGSAAYATYGKKITVDLDGHERTIRTFSGNVQTVLASDGITLSPHDRVTVGGHTAVPNSRLTDGDEVVVTFAKPVTIAIDGQTAKATVHDRTIGGMLKRVGFKPPADAYVSDRMATPLSRLSNKVVVSTPKSITIEADGKKRELTSSAPTVGQALDAAHVTLDSNDQVQPAHGDLLSAGDAIKVTRIEQVDKTETVPVQPVVYKDDKTLAKGTDKVLDPGKPGRARQHVMVTIADGQQRSRFVLSSRQLAKPETRIIARGTFVEPNGVWDKIAACESGGNWHINTGNGYYGGLQFSLGTWKSLGAPGRPDQQSREVQIKYAKILQARSGWGQWGCAGARNN